MINGRDTVENQWFSSPEAASRKKRGIDPKEEMGENASSSAVKAF